jgi:hypothetical protein
MRRRKLLRLGIGKDEVHKASRARKGHWRMSQMSLVRWAMNNDWLEEQGLPSLEKQWCSICLPFVAPHGQSSRLAHSRWSVAIRTVRKGAKDSKWRIGTAVLRIRTAGGVGAGG